MNAKAFVVMQVGAKDSQERKRANEVYDYIVKPALAQFEIEPYRADLDVSPGAITPKILSELIDARVVIADLTGRNPNVFYELGIAHSFTKPLISIADSVKWLPFDAKDERVIELGDYPESGLAYAQGEAAKVSLTESLKIVLADGYAPPSPLKDVAADRSLDALAPENPIVAEMAQMREAIDEVRSFVKRPRIATPPNVRADLEALRAVVERNLGAMDPSDFEMLVPEGTSDSQRAWTDGFYKTWLAARTPARDNDPWGSAPPATTSAFTDEPPF